jgi:hypothetical protein
VKAEAGALEAASIAAPATAAIAPPDRMRKTMASSSLPSPCDDDAFSALNWV